MLAAILGPLAAAVVAAPYIVDVEAYKPAIVQAVKEATGRELVIEGPLKLSMFPRPRISARQVRFANALGAKGAQMVDVRWVGVSPSWWALLHGSVEVGRLTLYKPVIVLETDAKGRPNWEFNPGAGVVQPEGAASAGLHLAIGRLRIVQGTLSYTNPATGRTLTAGQVDVTASMGSLEGPLTLVGSATVNGVPVDLDIDVGGPTGSGHAARLKVKVQGGTLDFVGRISRLGPAADIDGRITIATGALTDFVGAVMRAVGEEQPGADIASLGQFTFDGGLQFSPERLALTDFRISIGRESATGSMVLETGAELSLEAHLSVPRLDVDAWRTLLSRPGVVHPDAPPLVASVPKTGSIPETPMTAVLSPFPPDLDVALTLEAAEAQVRGGTLRDVSFAVESHQGVLAALQVGAVLPGAMVVKASVGSSLQSPGEISLSGPKLRETLSWLGVDTAGIPEGGLQSLALEGKLAAAGNGLQVRDLAIGLDGQRGTGSGAVTFDRPLAASARLQFEHLALDPYVPVPASESPAAVPALPATPSATAPPPAAPPDKDAPSLGLVLEVGNLGYRGEELKGVDADIGLQGNVLKVNVLKVADLLGAKLDLRGQVTDFLTMPRVDVSFSATVPDAEKLLAYAGLPKFLNGRIGAATAGGAIVGTADSLTLRNATATMLGVTARATGSLALGEKFRFDFPNFALQAQDGSRLLSAATGRNQTGVGAISAAGAFKGTAETAVFNGTLTAVGTAMSGQIGATLGARPTITANLRIPGTLDFDDWLGVSAGNAAAQTPAPSSPAPPPAAGPAPGSAVRPSAGAPRRATGKPIDLSALRAFDATLTLETTAIEVASLRVTYADLQASLRNGVFRLAKLTGQFYGGAVDFAGTLDASRAALSVDLQGSLQGIYLGEMLRGTAGTNTFGNEHLTVAVDGKITVMDIAVQGQGTSPEQIRDSLVGQGTVSGYLYPSVVGGSLGFATFATGLGSIFSTEMGFSSAVLQAFVNGQNPVSGHVSLSGGALSLQDHTVQGQNAVALINSRTSLTAATTDTTIALDTGTRGSTDYVMTVKGPVASPTMTTTGR